VVESSHRGRNTPADRASLVDAAAPIRRNVTTASPVPAVLNEFSATGHAVEVPLGERAAVGSTTRSEDSEHLLPGCDQRLRRSYRVELKGAKHQDGCDPEAQAAKAHPTRIPQTCLAQYLDTFLSENKVDERQASTRP